ncbi:MAG: hypothetical protein ABJG41_18300 [Cyclobacteriaceae bacterium]
MKYCKIFLILLISASCASSKVLEVKPIYWTSEKEDGYYEDYHSNGNIHFQYFIKNGLYDSVFRDYYLSGQLEFERNFRNGYAAGPRYYFYDNGILSSVVFFENGLKNGEAIQFRKDSTIEKQGTYKDGLTHGSYVRYRKNSQKKFQTSYANGIRNGFQYLYNVKGNPTSRWTYVDGKREKMFKQYVYHKNDSLKTSYYTTVFKQADQTLKSYHDNGLLHEIGEIKNNKREGEWIEYDRNGEIVERAFYIKGKKQK